MSNPTNGPSRIVALAGVLAVEVATLPRDRGLPEAPEPARRVAPEFAIAVISFDHERIDQDLARVLSFGTEGFERDLLAAMGPDFVEGIRRERQVSTGRIVAGPTAQRVTDPGASFLVIVSQRIVPEGSDRPARQVRVPMLLTVSTGEDPKIERVQVAVWEGGLRATLRSSTRCAQTSCQRRALRSREGADRPKGARVAGGAVAGEPYARRMFVLSAEQARVLGALAEKQFTTPQQYPLSLNALVAACNQTSNRDPVVAYPERVVADELSQLKAGGLVRFVHATHGRGVTKYRQVLEEVLDLTVEELALIAVLMLRGPQTAGELRSRTDRMAAFDDLRAVETVLDGLAAREAPLVERLERQAGQKEARFVHLLCGAEAAEEAGARAAEAGPASTGAPRGPGRVEALEDDVRALRAELDALRAELDELRAELDELRTRLG